MTDGYQPKRDDISSEPASLPELQVELENTEQYLAAERVASEQKVGHSFGGNCCDMRRASIIVNIIIIVFDVLAIVFALSVQSDPDEFEEDFGDSFLNDYLKEEHYRTFIAMIASQVAFAVIGIIGAMAFSTWVVAIAILGYVGTSIALLVEFLYADLVFLLIFLYSHLFLFFELKKGTMTKENYEMREKQSCCCF